MRRTGQQREGRAEEIEFTLVVATLDGSKHTVVHNQFMNRYTLHGVAPGELVRVIYDRENPTSLVVEGHVSYRTEVNAGEIVVVKVEDV